MSDPQPLLLGSSRRRLFAVLQAARTRARAGVLICPPFLHEQIRSYRLFALLSAALAEQGLTVLRFDYFGTGDSDGADVDFSLRGAYEDALTALATLRTAIGEQPLIVMGVRAGALPALHAAAGHAAALWLWQPVFDGAAYLDELRQRDTLERKSRLGPSDTGDADSLLGFRCNAQLFEDLGNEHATLDLAGSIPVTVLDARDNLASSGTNRQLQLASVLHEWSTQVDLGHFPKAAVNDLARQLSSVAEIAGRG